MSHVHLQLCGLYHMSSGMLNAFLWHVLYLTFMAILVCYSPGGYCLLHYCAQLTKAIIGQMSFLQCLGLFFVIMLPALDLHLTFFGFRFLLGVSLERV